MTEPARLATTIDMVGPTSTTPSDAPSTGGLRQRRLFVLAANLLTYAALAAAMASILGTGGWSALDGLLFLCFLVATPWTVLGFWNALLGLWLLHGRPDGLHAVAPFAAAADGAEPVRVRTAVLMTLRNENPTRAMARMRAVKASLDRTGTGAAFSYFILSDTSDPDVARAETEAVAAWRRAVPDPDTIVYRRRDRNTGFKAGNVRDFCERWGRDHELMLPLDADSLMTGDAIVRLVRVMQARPEIGILQSLVVGAPSASAFARIFQFGMRHGMRAYTMGSAWWIGDCGPFWGHNALVRIAPFAEHCRLPVLPGGPPLGGHVLSHDQVEATLMRRAGYEVRILPDERGSFEENPPTVFDFSTRDLRWCQGNMQYFRLLAWPGLLLMSRFQLAWAILMFLGIPAMTLMIALAPVKAAAAEPGFPSAAAAALYSTFLLMYLAPKLAGLADILLTRGGAARYGGPARLVAGAAVEIVFSFMLGAATTFRLTVFMIGLAFGRSVVWNGQSRDVRGVAWRSALAELWAPTLFGVAVCGSLALVAPAVLWWSLPLTLGYLVAVPFAVVTASPALGKAMKHARLCAVPEELAMPEEIRAVRAGA